MIAANLINSALPHLSLNDTIRFATEMFAEHCVTHLAIVNGQKLEGILPAEAVLHLPDKDITLISSCKQDFIPAFVIENLPGIDTFEILAKNELSILPVTDFNYNYIGCIRADELLFKVSNYYSFKEQGAVIILKIGIRDYNLSEIARIVENENAKILVVYMDLNEEMESYSVTLKINTLDISNIVATLERYNYNIVFTFPSNKRDDIYKDRYDLLMKILDI